MFPAAGRLEGDHLLGRRTDRNPWAIHFTGKIDPTTNIHVGSTINGT